MAGDKIVLVARGGPGGGPMVPDYEAQEAGVRRFVGRLLDRSRGKEFVDPETNEPKRHAVFVPLVGDAAFVQKDKEGRHAYEYLRHLRHGDLLPGDEETARWAGVAWDPGVLGFSSPGPDPTLAPEPAKLFSKKDK